MTDHAESTAPPPDTAGPPALPAERLKAFADAVVAIAMTLLILPLMESVGDAAADHLSSFEWLNQNAGQLFSFALSFVLIANFWLTHHRLFAGIHRVTNGLLWLTIAWMFTIVWLPIPTALLGQLETDAGQEILYIGTLALTSLVMFLSRLYVLRHPSLHDIPEVTPAQRVGGGSGDPWTVPARARRRAGVPGRGVLGDVPAAPGRAGAPAHHATPLTGVSARIP